MNDGHEAAVGEDAQPADWAALFGEAGLSPIRLGDTVIERLTRAILDGRLKPGDALPSESQIAAQFGISKPIAREALRELAAMGVVQVQQGKVSRVRAVDSGPLSRFYRFAIAHSRQGMLEAVELRRILEPQFARLAATRRTADDLSRLRSILAAMEAALGTPDWIEADLSFHEHLAAMTHNRLVVLQSKGLEPIVREMMVRFGSRLPRSVADWRATFGRHQRIGAAIASGDAHAAEEAMRQHFEAAEDAITEIYGKHAE